ncbi:unnamed protein product [Adineta ricciae]|uniref:Uncharacterized protein n=1 Tax=Adineta ricciae TaxID=249248 RepID=A0A815S384_ADIRI|nr:unnamed protein product [Adineta ricciae]CAF1609980.1 unnamed protein product [Adineta ricciae]
MEKLSFVWLQSASENSQDLVELERFRILIDNLMIFTEEELCTDYIEKAVKDDRNILVLNTQLVDKFLPKMHEQSQISAIYIYGSSQEEYEEWINKYTKIRGIFLRVNELIKKLLFDYNERDRSTNDDISFDIFNGHSTNELNGAFIYSQLLINCLTRLQSNDDEIDEFISFYKSYKKENKIRLESLEEFLEKYKTKSALWWYTTDKGVFRILNEALRNKEIDLLYYLRLFLHDIGKELQDIKDDSCPDEVYRGQCISSREIKRLQAAVGQLISVNTFFSTSNDINVCFYFHSPKSEENNLENVLFQIGIDRQSNNIKPFADISKISSKKDEMEILFMAGSVFRVIGVCPYTEEYWLVQMKLCSIDDEEFSALMDYMISEYEPNEVNLFSLGNILLCMGKLHDAKKYYRRFLKNASNDHDNRSGCYHSLGIIERENGKYKKSLAHFKNSLQMDEQLLSKMNRSKDHRNIGLSYNSIAIVYNKKGDYDQAIDFFNKALTIFKGTSGQDCLDVAGCCYNIGSVYQTMKKYTEAHDYYTKALEIRKKHPPENRLDIGQSQCSLGNIHLLSDELDLALEKYYSALEIFKKSCPDLHINIAAVLENIGLVHEKKNDCQRSLAYLQKARNIYTSMSFHERHPAIKRIDGSIFRVTSKLTN